MSVSTTTTRDYSRTEYVFGKDALERMQKATFFIFGCQGIGAEVAKNIFLTGCSVSLCDPEPITSLDLCSNPFFTTADIGKRRDEVLAQNIKELNTQKQSTQINVTDLRQLSQYQTVVYTHSAQFTPLQVSQYCREHKIPFVLAQTFGLCGRVFSDFGAEFVVYDKNGERIEDYTASEMMVDKLDEKFTIFLGTKDNLPYQDGALVKITDLKFNVRINTVEQPDMQTKLSELFNGKQYRIKMSGLRMFQIIFDESDAEFLAYLAGCVEKGAQVAYLRGGYIRLIKEPVTVKFQPFEQQIKAPTFCDDMLDFSKMENKDVFVEIYRYLDTNVNVLQKYAAPWAPEAYAEFYAALLAQTENKSLLESDLAKRLVKLFVGQHMGQFSPVCSIVGGWGAQEALKAVSGKYTPILQNWYYDCFELLKELPGDKEAVLNKSRYDGHIAIFGQKMQQQIQSQSIFLVGAGALGCEIIKFLALSGACSTHTLDVTDLDSIENSNLSRQFLFREKDAGKMKSSVAAERAKVMNPDCRINPMTVRIGDNNPMPADFWLSKSIIVNALDNVATRKFVDRKCIQYCRPLLESGTLGQKANSQVIVPRLTQIYSATNDPEGGEAPACTIHNFPNNITHCIVYATSEFKGMFEAAVEDLKKWQECNSAADVDAFCATLQTDMSALKGRFARLLQITQFPIETEADCIRFACLQFRRFFSKMIRRLLELNPVDSKNSDGSPFWAADKRPPVILDIDFANKNHVSFLRYCSKLIGDVFGMHVHFDAAAAEKIAATARVEDVVTADEAGQLVDAYTDKLHLLVQEKFKFKPAATAKISPIAFEKDDATNGHIAFLTAFSNLRAENYGIPQADIEEIRRIAGNIIPAMITTTAAIVGHVGVEFVKLALHFDKMEDFKQVYMNYALPMIQISENEHCTEYKLGATDKTFTVWDYIDMNGNPRIQDVMDFVKQKYDMDVDGIMCGAKSLFMGFMDDESKKERRIRDLLKEMKEVYEGEILLAVLPDGDGELPALRLRD